MGQDFLDLRCSLHNMNLYFDKTKFLCRYVDLIESIPFINQLYKAQTCSMAHARVILLIVFDCL